MRSALLVLAALVVDSCAPEKPPARHPDPADPSALEAPAPLPGSLSASAPVDGGDFPTSLTGGVTGSADGAAPEDAAAPVPEHHHHPGMQMEMPLGGGGAAHDMTDMKNKPTSVEFTCPMHPEVVSPKPGHCPKCGMTLVPKKSEKP